MSLGAVNIAPCREEVCYKRGAMNSKKDSIVARAHHRAAGSPHPHAQRHILWRMLLARTSSAVQGELPSMQRGKALRWAPQDSAAPQHGSASTAHTRAICIRQGVQRPARTPTCSMRVSVAASISSKAPGGSNRSEEVIIRASSLNPAVAGAQLSPAQGEHRNCCRGWEPRQEALPQ